MAPGCYQEQEYHCLYGILDGIHGRSFCSNSSDIWMRANWEYGPWTIRVPKNYIRMTNVLEL
jgi:hypothetical protein